MLAYDYPLLSVFWTLVLFSLFVLVLFVVLWAFVDNFRRKDHSGWAKAGWFLLIFFFPILGVFIYLLARPADVPAYGRPARAGETPRAPVPFRPGGRGPRR